MLKTILVDDERPALKALEYQLKQYKEVHKSILDIYKAIGDKTSFDKHYSEVKKIFNDELGVKLSFI